MSDIQTVPENDELELVFAEISGEAPSPACADPALAEDHEFEEEQEPLEGDLFADTLAQAPAPALLERFAGLVAALSFLAFFAMLEGTRPGWLLVQPCSLGMIAGIALGGLIASHGPHRVGKLIGTLFGGKARDEEQAYELRDMCLRGRRLCYAGAFVQTIFAAVQVLSSLDQPAAIGPAIGTALTALVYGTLLAELLFGSAMHWVRARVD